MTSKTQHELIPLAFFNKMLLEQRFAKMSWAEYTLLVDTATNATPALVFHPAGGRQLLTCWLDPEGREVKRVYELPRDDPIGFDYWEWNDETALWLRPY